MSKLRMTSIMLGEEDRSTLAKLMGLWKMGMGAVIRKLIRSYVHGEVLKESNITVPAPKGDQSNSSIKKSTNEA